MKFYEALKLCVDDMRYISRADWNGSGQYVYFVRPGRDYEGYFVLRNAQGKNIVGWVPTQTDLYSDMWIELTVKPSKIENLMRGFV